MLASSNPGDVVLDPFFGSGTTGAVAKMLGRNFIGCERETSYADAAHARIAAVEPIDPEALKAAPEKRSEPRIPFLSVVEGGMLRPGEVLTDARGRHQALVRADGRLSLGPAIGSIHKIGATVQGLDACNGWTFWHYERDGGLDPIDELRRIARIGIAKAGA